MEISRRFRASSVAAIATAMLAVTVGSTASGASTPGTGALDKWHSWHSFYGLTVMAPDSALAVGYVTDPCCWEALSQRWDGTDWAYEPPHDGDASLLAGVDSLSDTDAWAVGGDHLTTRDQALTEHWDGDRWTVVPTGTSGVGVSLSDVAMVTSKDVWAVGTYYWGEGGMIPVVMHWDGTAWTRLPDLFSQGTLDTVEAISADDIWATGLYSGGVWHWDGTTWSNFTNPVDGFFSMGAASTNDIWLAGQLGGQGFGHWDGQSWTFVGSPVLGRYGGLMTGVTALSKKDAWAVGYTLANDQSYDPDEAVIEHWDGKSWTVVPCPHSRQAYDMLTAVDARSPNDVWAVGTHGTDASRLHGHRFMLHWDGSTWTRYRHS